MFLAYYDQWLDDGWFRGADAPTWLTRFRDEYSEETRKWKINIFTDLGYTGRVRGPRFKWVSPDTLQMNISFERKWHRLTIGVEETIYSGSGQDRGQLATRRLEVYGEWMRGTRPPFGRESTSEVLSSSTFFSWELFTINFRFPLLHPNLAYFSAPHRRCEIFGPGDQPFFVNDLLRKFRSRIPKVKP